MPHTQIMTLFFVGVCNNGIITLIYCCYFPGGRADSAKKANTFIWYSTTVYTFGKLFVRDDFYCGHRLWGYNRANAWGSTLNDFLMSRGLSVVFPDQHSYLPASSRSQSSTLDIFLKHSFHSFNHT